MSKGKAYLTFALERIVSLQTNTHFFVGKCILGRIAEYIPARIVHSHSVP